MRDRDQYPLLLNFPYFDLYRKQVVKQADLVLALFWCGDSFTPQEKARDFRYYELLTVRDSSLSASSQAIIAAEVGQLDLAYDYFAEAALMDLDDLEHNTRDGIHIASVAGTWIAAVAGFGGLRDHGGRLTFAPRLPAALTRLRFRIMFRERSLLVDVNHEHARYTAARRRAAGDRAPRRAGDADGRGGPQAADPALGAPTAPAAPAARPRAGPPPPVPPARRLTCVRHPLTPTAPAPCASAPSWSARGAAAALILDDAQLAAIGGGRKTPPVRVTVNGHTFNGRIARMGGETLLGFNKAVRAACGVDARRGDRGARHPRRRPAAGRRPDRRSPPRSAPSRPRAPPSRRWHRLTARSSPAG